LLLSDLLRKATPLATYVMATTQGSTACRNDALLLGILRAVLLKEQRINLRIDLPLLTKRVVIFMKDRQAVTSQSDCGPIGTHEANTVSKILLAVTFNSDCHEDLLIIGLDDNLLAILLEINLKAIPLAFAVNSTWRSERDRVSREVMR
jgi:hypothetical protein